MAQPRLTLRVPQFDRTFENFSSVMLPVGGFDTLEIILEGSLAEIRVATVRVLLNEMPMTPFVTVNPMPAGVRAIVRIRASMSPDYTLAAGVEKMLALTAMDTSGVTYRAQFYLAVDPALQLPETARSTKPRTQQAQVQAPAQNRAPKATFQSEWPVRTRDRSLTLEAQASDSEGLFRIVLEVNGRDVEEILLQNERPVRKQGGRVVRGKIPGSVDGDGKRLSLAIPVRLDNNRINVVALRITNTLGLSTRIDRTVEVTDR
jgi:hypothetical protein